MDPWLNWPIVMPASKPRWIYPNLDPTDQLPVKRIIRELLGSLGQCPLTGKLIMEC